MHAQANLGSFTFSQRPFSYLFGQVRRLTNELRRRLNLSPAPNRSVIKLLQADFLRTRHALAVMQSLGHFAPALRQKEAPAEARAVPKANCSGSYAWLLKLG
jgi:hypothetical protein